MEDRSLDEFLTVDDEDDGDDDDSPDDGHSGTDAASEVRDRGAAGDPATATATWDPDGGACAACGAMVRRRWRSEDGLVCGGCKEW